MKILAMTADIGYFAPVGFHTRRRYVFKRRGDTRTDVEDRDAIYLLGLTTEVACHSGGTKVVKIFMELPSDLQKIKQERRPVVRMAADKLEEHPPTRRKWRKKIRTRRQQVAEENKGE